MLSIAKIREIFLKTIALMPSWAVLYKFSKGSLGKTYLLLGILPVFVRLIKITRFIGINMQRYEAMFYGAIAFLVGYILLILGKPKLIPEFSSSEEYKKKYINDSKNINIEVEFKALEKYSKYSYLQYVHPIFGALKHYLPIRGALRRGAHKKKVVGILSTALFEAKNYSHLWIRLVVAVLLLSGFLLMNYMIILAIYELLFIRR